MSKRPNPAVAPVPSRTLPALACCMVLAASVWPLPAPASPVPVDFQVTVDTAGALQGQTFAGHFVYDDASPTPFGSETLFPLLSFAFHFDGVDHDLGDLSYGDLVFAGRQVLGLDAVGPGFSFVPATGPFAASFAFDLGNGRAGNGSVRLSPAELPEPAPAALLATALLALAWRRSRSR